MGYDVHLETELQVSDFSDETLKYIHDALELSRSSGPGFDPMGIRFDYASSRIGPTSLVRPQFDPNLWEFDGNGFPQRMEPVVPGSVS